MGDKIAILRGINVGGKRKILMKDLKLLCESLGFTNTRTYIQSGNILFNSNESCNTLELKLQKEVKNKYDFEVPVIVFNTSDLQTAMNQNPFYKTEEDIPNLHLTFLAEEPSSEKIKQITELNYSPDLFKIIGKYVFIFCQGKYHQSKLTNNFLEKKLGVTATTRNWKTVLKLKELSN